MLPAWVYLSLELSTVVLFALTVAHARRRGRAAVLELCSAAVYGVLLEWGDILLFETYTYSPGFFLTVGPVPITIGLCWALLIYGAMQYSDQLGLPAWAAPFADALWAIMLDLAFDAVAVRLDFWRWNIPLADGYFGVPAGNFSAWLYVALGFSAWTRWVRGRRRGQTALELLAPLAAFMILLGGILWFDLLVWLLYPRTPGDHGMAVFAATVAVFALIVGAVVWRRGLRPTPGVDLLTTATRWLMHGYFGLWLVVWLVAPATRLPGMDAPLFLLGMALALLILEALLLMPVLRRGELRLQLGRLPRWTTGARGNL